ncbi:glycosyltransferase [Micromonospora sp. B11E3]|uniref:glycosyltransferase n=1 Tax=Micromonospora sp. B11E3 TaxID=3153562 RepID=UPI00325D9FA7
MEPGVTGMTFAPQDPDGLSEAVHALLSDTERARTLARRARALVHQRYGWASIAQRTAATYAAAVASAPAFTAERAARRMAEGRAAPRIAEGNLLAAAGLR